MPTNLIGGYGKDLSNLFSFIRTTSRWAWRFRYRSAIEPPKPSGGARIQRDQLQALYRSQDQAVEMDVRNAARRGDCATACTLFTSGPAKRRAALEGGRSLYEVGRSTTFLLLQRQSELTSARTLELLAETDYNKALADLQRATAATLRVNNVVVDPNRP